MGRTGCREGETPQPPHRVGHLVDGEEQVVSLKVLTSLTTELADEVLRGRFIRRVAAGEEKGYSDKASPGSGTMLHHGGRSIRGMYVGRISGSSLQLTE